MITEALQYVKGAVAKKGLVPEMTHFRIQDNTIKSYNGRISLCSPIDLDIEASPKAITFTKAIASCRGTTAVGVTKAGRLSIKSGKFKAYIECLDEIFPDITPTGEYIKLETSFIENLRILAPFMAEDASKSWARGILLRGSYAYVTNNIIMIQTWLKTPFPIEVNIPAATVKELVRIKEEPIALQIDHNSITFHYEGNRWLRSNLSDLTWPDIEPIFAKQNSAVPFPPDFFALLEDLKPFTDELDRVTFIDGHVATSKDEGVGAWVECEGLPDEGVYNLTQLSRLQDIAERIDFTMYPEPCIFYGNKLRGAMIGMRSI